MTPATRRRLRRAAFWAAFVVLGLLLVAMTNPARSQPMVEITAPCWPPSLAAAELEHDGLEVARAWATAAGWRFQLWLGDGAAWALTLDINLEGRVLRCVLGRGLPQDHPS